MEVPNRMESIAFHRNEVICERINLSDPVALSIDVMTNRYSGINPTSLIEAIPELEAE